MFTYDPATGVMFTCDAFGMHYCSEEPFDVDQAAIMPHYRWLGGWGVGGGGAFLGPFHPAQTGFSTTL
jgi:hypothetical protein